MPGKDRENEREETDGGEELFGRGYAHVCLVQFVSVVRMCVFDVELHKFVTTSIVRANVNISLSGGCPTFAQIRSSHGGQQKTHQHCSDSIGHEDVYCSSEQTLSDGHKPTQNTTNA